MPGALHGAEFGLFAGLGFHLGETLNWLRRKCLSLRFGYPFTIHSSVNGRDAGSAIQHTTTLRLLTLAKIRIQREAIVWNLSLRSLRARVAGSKIRSTWGMYLSLHHASDIARHGQKMYSSRCRDIRLHLWVISKQRPLREGCLSAQGGGRLQSG